jgi:hypothetical protein
MVLSGGGMQVAIVNSKLTSLGVEVLPFKKKSETP